MDILLTHGYFLNEDAKERRIMRPYPPLGILYISAYLKRKGLSVKVVDTTFIRRNDLETIILKARPPVVGIYCNMMTRRSVLRIIRCCRQAGAIVVLGGPDPANYPNAYLDHGADVIVVGEGEHTLEELLPHLLQYGPTGMHHIRGIIYRESDGTPVRTPPRPLIPDLDALPFPDRDAIDMTAYLRSWRTHHGPGSVSLITARGCPYTCTWCSHAVFGFTHRRRSPENVADEIEWILRRYQPDMLWYADDVFTIHYGWFFQFATELRRRGIRIPFETISRADRLNEDVVATLAEMGCIRLWIGAESGSQRVLDAMQRRIRVEQVREAVHLLQRYGIETGLFIMFGYEGETLDDIVATVHHVKHTLPDHYLTTIAYPIKGTPYYDRVRDRIIARTAWAEGSDRDLTVAGRYSQRFYRWVIRWMVGEVELSRLRRARPFAPFRWSRAWLNARLGRLGMRWTQHEREGAKPHRRFAIRRFFSVRPGRSSL